MILKFALVLFFVAAVASDAAFFKDMVPRIKCKCVKVRDCAVHRNNLKLANQGSDGVYYANFLFELTCGFIKNDPYVCCPINNANTEVKNWYKFYMAKMYKIIIK
ncbi:uncharacterized protein LOC106639868 [Copidosoma floridanum]|uniref:uncharacterized protein LOC106639868 n=1 Tax=Copidosoma floridanum TaxID=29053 RepID=UPI0006C94F94|nr:uncharacterized protein LOC106639868 [Copidosoma floridanum]